MRLVKFEQTSIRVIRTFVLLMRIDSQKSTPNLGIYVHVPFCARHCEFCAFYEQAPLRHDIDRYLDGAVRELATLNLPRRADTVFWGGGTPGLLLPRDMERLALATIEAAGGKPSEWTVEMTPATMRPERLRMLRDMGVTRISMGVQSFDENILRALGRIHTVKQVYDAIDASQGFYRNDVLPQVRSRMNIPYFLPDETLTARFVAESKAAVLLALKGHKAVGGLRASLYNALPVEGAQALVEFMRDFQQRNG